MSGACRYPQLLLPYVARNLEPDETAEVAAHIARCAECRQEVEALGSMLKSVRLLNRTDHVPSEDLIAYDAGELAPDAILRRRIETHLDGCAECRLDLHALERERRVRESLEAAPIPPRGHATTGAAASAATRGARRRSWTVSTVAAAAAAALMILMVPGRIDRPERKPWLRQAQSATFAAPRRGSVGNRTLTGGGPWSITVWLPFDAPDGTYALRIEREDGSPVSGLEALAPTDGNGTLTLLVGSLDAPGSYRLVLAPQGRAPDRRTEASYVYPFKVLAPAARAPGPPGDGKP